MQDRPIIIMVSGFKRSGKDFISNYISKSFPVSKVFSFAEPLKDIVATTMNMGLNTLDEYKNNSESLFIHRDDGYAEKITDFRQILQRFGTEAMKKHFGDDVWVDLAIKKLEDINIISDWRFKTEYEAMRKVGDVITIRVEDLNIKPDDHISEHDLDDFTFDFKIDNSAKDDTFLISLRRFLRFFEETYQVEVKHP